MVTWQLHRAEKALEQARLERERLDAEDADYGGIRLEQTAKERSIESRIAELKMMKNTKQWILLALMGLLAGIAIGAVIYDKPKAPSPITCRPPMQCPEPN